MKEMTKEVRDAALNAMNRALTPRNEDGLIEPVVFFDMPQKEMLVPYFDPSVTGGLKRVACFADEFADGKLPPDLKYTEGHLIPPKTPIESLFPQYAYSNPEYNLPIADRMALISGREILAKKAEQQVSQTEQVSNAAEEKAGSSSKSKDNQDLVVAGDSDIHEFPGGMYVICKGQKITICNFCLRVTQHRRVQISPYTCEDEYQIDVLCGQSQKTILVPVRELDNLIKKIQRELPSCTVSSSFARASQMIVNHVRKKLPNADTYNVFRYTGFVPVNNFWVYAHDLATPPLPQVLFETGFSITHDPSMSPVESMRRAMEFLTVTPRSELIIPLFLLAHLGPLFELFNAAGYVPRFVPFLNGRTGAFKTAIALCLFRLFDQQGKVPEASFRDTPVALELKLGKANGHVLLIDDFQPAVTAVAGKQNLEKLESVIRFVGDGIGKARGCPELELRKTPSPAGCAIVTGEDTGGSHSTLLRCLVLSVNKGDIDGKKLKEFQNHPEYLKTHMYHFLTLCSDSSPSIVNHIREKFTDCRDMFSAFVKEARLADTGATLMLTGAILLDYARTIQALTCEEKDCYMTLFVESIKNALIYSENYSREMNPTAMYLRALFDLHERGSLPLAASPNAYNSSRHIGYMYEGNWWLRNRDIFPKVTNYWQLLNINFPLREDKVLESLADSGLIEVDHENRDGKLKRLFGRRSSIEGRPRMMVLRIQQSHEYLTKELGEF